MAQSNEQIISSMIDQFGLFGDKTFLELINKHVSSRMITASESERVGFSELLRVLNLNENSTTQNVPTDELNSTQEWYLDELEKVLKEDCISDTSKLPNHQPSDNNCQNECTKRMSVSDLLGAPLFYKTNCKSQMMVNGGLSLRQPPMVLQNNMTFNNNPRALQSVYPQLRDLRNTVVKRNVGVRNNNIYANPQPSTSGLSKTTFKRRIVETIILSDDDVDSDECAVTHVQPLKNKRLCRNPDGKKENKTVDENTVSERRTNKKEIFGELLMSNQHEPLDSNADIIQQGGSRSNTSTLKQHDDAVQRVDEFNYFTKGVESETFVKKFGLTARRMMFDFKTNNDENPLNWLKNAIEEILNYMCRQFSNNDIVGIALESEGFPDKPLGISYRKLSELNVEVVMNVISKVFQSNSTFFSDEGLIIRVDSIHVPVGCGFSKVDGKCVSFEDFSIAKNSIFVVKTTNNVCLAGALVVAIEFIKNNYNRNVLKKYDGKRGICLLEQQSKALCDKANVDLSQGGGYEHIDTFQEYLTEYSIIVYNNREGKSVYFEGSRDENKPCLNLLMEDNHYNTILSLTGAFSASYFCERCRVKFSDKNRHKRCPFQCPCCHGKPPCEVTERTIKCSSCMRNFRGEKCFQTHKTTACPRFKKCEKCYVVYVVNKKDVHQCGKKFCYTCGSKEDVGHFCYMQPNTLGDRKRDELKMFLLIFYDLETTQDKPAGNGLYTHEVNLCVSQHVCDVCITNTRIDENCNYCGPRQRIFRNKPIENFLEYVASMSEKFKVTAVAHNMKAFDGCFILKHLFSNVQRWAPQVIRTGTKLMSITCRQSIRFIDSLNFIQMPLSKFSKAFDLIECKGYFPHYFNRSDNQNYTGPLPDMSYYGYNSMKSEDRSEFIHWYNKQIEDGAIFDMSSEIVKYCVADVNVLRMGCLKFRACFIETNNVDPLLECITIASACNLVYRRNFLKPNSIGIIPNDGYTCNGNHSKIAIQWLEWEAQCRGESITHAGNSREKILPGNLIVDGFCEASRTVYEFYGCYWHGCIKCYPNQTTELSVKKDIMFIRRENTVAKEERIKIMGYNLVTKWECAFRKEMKYNPVLKNFCDDDAVNIVTPLNPRDAFFGGRTNACKLYYKCKEGEKIKYLDVCSLYPYVNKYGKYPVGHPKIYKGDECANVDLTIVNGLIKCVVLPPTDLYHPLLPYRCHGKLMFPLCKTCTLNLNQNKCQHNESERQLDGTYVSDELQKAIALGYKVVSVSEIWEYETVQYDSQVKSGGLFSEYVNTFLKIKQECSGWPSWCKTDQDKDHYINEYETREGIRLEKGKICKNSGLRMLSKIMLNCFWGKFGQRENLQATQIIKDSVDLFKLLTNPSVAVHNITIINPEVLLVTWDRIEDDVSPTKTVNVSIAAYTTATARLKLFSYLESLGDRVLYYDTDSVIFIHREGETELPVGDFLGDLTDELVEYGDGSYITEFVSGGPKNYAYKFWSENDNCHKTVCKVKGLTLNYQNSESVNFDVMKSMVLGHHPEMEVTLKQKIITRNVRYDVISKDAEKKYRVHYTKNRRLKNSFDTVPYGFILNVDV